MHSKFELFVIILGTTGFLSMVICETSQDTQIVNVAVFCDYECSRLFQHNKSDIDRHVVSMFWDANISFKTLTLSSIFFRVSSITQINNQKFQPEVFSKTRGEDGGVHLSEVLPEVQQWFYEQKELIISPSTNVHIGLFITGEKGADQIFIAEQSSLCNIDDKNKIFYSTLILRLGGHAQNYCSALAAALGVTLGNPAPTTQPQKFLACQDKSYIDTYQCGSHHYFFSKCADKQISDFLNSNECLHKSKPSEIIQDNDNYRYTYHLAPTFTEQCRLQYNSLSVFTKQEEENCQKTKCHDKYFLFFNKYVGDIYPISGTACGTSKICFRDRCISKGYRLANFKTKTCLAPSSNFDSGDKPRLINCPSLPTPLDQFRFIPNGNQGHFFIATPFSSLDANANEDKCLSVDLTGEHLIFQPCHLFEHKSWLEWIFIGWSGVDLSTKFMLYHPQTKKCLVVDHHNAKVVTSACYEVDESYWQVFEYEIPDKENLEFGYNAKSKGLMDIIQKHDYRGLVVIIVFLACLILPNNRMRVHNL